MSFFSLVATLLKRAGLSRRRAKERRSSLKGVRLRVEPLEGRILPSTLTVTNLLDSGTGSLRAQIAAAANGDIIVFDSSLRGQITLTSGELDIANAITIQGPGATTLSVSGGKTQRVLHILPNVSATIAGLTIADGDTSDFGAGIECEGSLTLKNSTVTDNRAGRDGGGIYFVVNNTGPASLTVTGCTFTSNSAADGGGIGTSVANRAGHVDVTITSTDFNQNRAGASGGAIDSFAQLTGMASASVTVTGGKFGDNVAASGGAIATTLRGADSSQGAVTLAGATIQNNTGQNGGGVFSELTSSGSSQTKALLSGVGFEANTASASGGGLYSTVTSADNGQAAFVLDARCFETDNTAQNGGGIYSLVATNGSGTSSATFGSNISFNVASESGGGIFSSVTAAGSGSATATLSGALVSDNMAGREGAGLFAQVTSKAGGPASAAVMNSTLSDNSNGPGGFGRGGGVSLTIDALASGSATATLIGDTVTGNTTQDGGGGVSAFVSSLGSGAAAVAITNTTVSGNSTATTAGGISLSVSNRASGSATGTLSGDTISANTALTTTGGGISADVSDAGAGQASLTISASTISGNSAASLGGGISGSVFNSAAGTGQLSLANDTISGNTASAGGGLALMCDDSFSVGQALLSVAASSITANVARLSSVAGGLGGDGGGLLASISNEGAGVAALDLGGSQITGNQADADGGGAMASLDSSRIGAALLAVDGSTVSGDTAGNRGGGFFSTSTAAGPSSRTTANVTLTNATIAGNRAVKGAGLYFDVSSSGHGASALTSLAGSTVSSNTAANQGGGVYSVESAAAGTSATVALTNDTLFANSASLGGGFFSNIGTADGTVGATLLSATVAFNNATSSGGGLDAAGNAFTVRSTIVAANTGGSSADAMGTFQSGGHNLIGKMDGSSGWAATDLTGTAGSPLDARLGNFGNFGGPTATVALLPGSPALQKGDPAGPSTDQRGVIRDKTAPTIGAVEVVIVSALKVVTDFATVPQGTSFNITVSAVNSAGKALPGFSGTVHFSSSDTAATLPADYTFTPADAGRHTFFQGVTLQTKGPKSIVVSADGLTRSLAFNVVDPIGTWTPLTNPAPAPAGTMLLLTDGTVLVQGGPTSANVWLRLTPDASGDYVHGTWSGVPPANLGRLYYPSNVLPDGRVFILGGEFTGPNATSSDTNTGEIFDPVANTWTKIANFPQPHLGDDPTALLPGGRVLAGYIGGPQTYIFDPKSNTWTFAANKLANDSSDEETWLTLPDGSILSYNITGNRQSQRYVPALGQWVDAGTVPVPLSDGNREIGPAFLLPDGRAFFLGDNSRTAFYTPGTNTWSAGPLLPHGLGVDDAPGAMMPNGHILFAADTPPQRGPTTLFEFDPVSGTLTPVLNAPGDGGPAFTERMLMLPSGQVLFTTGGSRLYVYTPRGNALAAGQPAITSVRNNGNGTFTLTGTQLGGISEGAAYGDDAEMSSNYPLVRLTSSSGQVFYARTFGWPVGVATGVIQVSTKFTLPAGIPAGDYSLVAVANGNASAPVSFTVAANGAQSRGQEVETYKVWKEKPGPHYLSPHPQVAPTALRQRTARSAEPAAAAWREALEED